ncbi:MAG: hypothetical protein ACP5D6_04940 [Kosmotogaceae bacterium]
MNEIWSSIKWFLVAGVIGFFVSYVFSGILKLSRRIFLLPYLGIVLIYITAFFWLNNIIIIELLSNNLILGIIAGVAVGIFLVSNVFSQPSSRKSKGLFLIIDILWIGIIYGTLDALFLNIIPVLIVERAVPQIWLTEWLPYLGVEALALTASLVIVLLYHLGYSEFRNKKVFLVIVGNALITIAFLSSSNPIGALISHAIMHIAAVIRGPETTIQLPPHKE